METPTPQAASRARRRAALLPRIYCDLCDKSQPYIFDFMPADELNDHDSEDIVCDVCHLVIATFHAK